MSKAVKLNDSNNKCSIIFKNSDGTDLNTISYRNSAITLTGNEVFELTPIYESDSYILNFSFLITKFYNTFSLVKKDNIEVKVFPYINGMSIKEIFTTMSDTKFSTYDDIFFIILVNNIPKYYIKDNRLDFNDWINFGVSFKQDKIQVFLNNFISRYTFDYETNKKIKITENYTLTKNKFIFLDGLIGLSNNIELNSFSEELVTLSESDFYDYAYTDFYKIRECDSSCLSATEVLFPEYNDKKVYKPRTCVSDSDVVCTFKETKIDPVTGKISQECSKTKLIEINSDYPTIEDFKDDIIQYTHYKTQFSLNEYPLSSKAIIDNETCELVYSSFELIRPITRVANYVEYLELKSDFSSKLVSLYSTETLLNWTTRMTAYKNVIDSGSVVNIGDEVFSNTSKIWNIKHNLSSYDIICHCFGKNNELIYPDSQYPVDENNYLISWGNSSTGGFGLLTKASSVTLFNQLQDKPFKVVHNLHTKTEPDLVQMQNIKENRQREEPVNFIEDGNKLIVELLEKYNDASFILINAADAMFYFREKSLEWNVEHNLNILGIHPQIYNEDFEVIQPSELYLVDENNIKVVFDKPQNGYIGLKKIGNPYWKNDIINTIIKKDSDGNYLGKFKLGDLSNINYDKNYGKGFYLLNENKKMQAESVITLPISSFTENKDTYVFEFIINKDDFINDININEIGLFDANDQLCFYSCGDNIYYPTEFSFRYKFIVYKEDIKI